MNATGLLLAMALCGFHIGITLLALFRAYRALARARLEGRADRRTMWRLAALRVWGVLAAFSGALLGLTVPLLLLEQWFALLRGYVAGLSIVMVGAWLMWLVSTVALDNCSCQWTGAHEESGREEGDV